MKLTTAIVDRIEITAKFDPDSESWWATADIDARHALTTGAWRGEARQANGRGADPRISEEE